jgi:hypothetical protein
MAPTAALPVFLIQAAGSCAVIGFTLTGGTSGVVGGEGEADPLVADCIVTGCSSSGILYQVSVEDSIVSENGRDGLTGDDYCCRAPRAVRCTIVRNGGSGISSGSAIDCEVSDNGLLFGVEGGEGFGVVGAAAGSRITGNAGGGFRPIFERGGNADSCIISNNGGDGISGATSDMVVKNCVIFGNDGRGVSLVLGGRLTLTRSTIVGNAAEGVHTQVSRSEWAAVTSSIIWGNGGRSISYGLLENGFDPNEGNPPSSPTPTPRSLTPEWGTSPRTPIFARSPEGRASPCPPTLPASARARAA